MSASAAGRMLGKYQVLRHLATGGMAEIYLARTVGHERFERYVVVKCIKPEFAENAQFVEMFLDEARISAALHHQHIVPVFDMGVEGGTLYFAMEYVHGQSVQAILEAVQIVSAYVPYEHALTIAIGAAHGLHYAHEKVELVHRDVTPSNVLVSYDGGVKVVDFGIAKATTRSTHTKSGVLKGKIAYMSPEQCRGKPLDRRTDIFALGILIYELTTSRRLFAEESDYNAMDRIVRGDVPPPQDLRGDYPDELAQIVMRCLAVDPAARYPTAEALVEDLLSFARRAMLTPTHVGLERYMRELFGKPAEPWVGLAVPALAAGSNAAVAPAMSETLASGVVVTTDARSGVLPRRRRLAPMIVAGIAAATVGAAITIWIGTRGDRAPATPTPSPSSRSTASTPSTESAPSTAPSTAPSVAPSEPALEMGRDAPYAKAEPVEVPATPVVAPARPVAATRAQPPKSPPPPPPPAESGSATKLRDAAILKPPD
jgi:serine/threonine protein kinase